MIAHTRMQSAQSEQPIHINGTLKSPLISNRILTLLAPSGLFKKCAFGRMAGENKQTIPIYNISELSLGMQVFCFQ